MVITDIKTGYRKGGVMSEIKMTDVFKLPMVVDGNDVESQPYQHSCMSYEMKSDITCDSSDDARYVAHAINSHDSMAEKLAKQQQEIAEYKAFMLGLKLSSEDEARLLDLLAKHKKGE